LSQGKANLEAPWLGLTGFSMLALMLSMLIFIGRSPCADAFDPRKVQMSPLLEVRDSLGLVRRRRKARWRRCATYRSPSSAAESMALVAVESGSGNR